MSLRRTAPPVAIAAALTLALVPAGAAQAATITACVKKTTGAATIVTGKRAKKACPKGSAKVRWSTTGAAGRRGATGPAGAPGALGPVGPIAPGLTVRDKNGTAIGPFMGLLPAPLPYIAVLKDGGIFYYLGSGQVLPIESPKFKTNLCLQTAAYLDTSDPASVAVYAGLVGGPTRVSFRATNPTFGPTSAWKLTTTTEPAAALQLYELNSSGACVVAGAPFTGTLIALEQVTAPVDVLGPLTIGS